MADTQETHQGTWYLDESGTCLHLVVPAAARPAVERLAGKVPGLAVESDAAPTDELPPPLPAPLPEPSADRPDQPPAPAAFKTLCNNLEIAVSQNGKDHPNSRSKLLAARAHPDAAIEGWRISRAIEKGEYFRGHWGAITGRLYSHGADDPDAAAMAENLACELPYKRRFIMQEFQKAQVYQRTRRSRLLQSRAGHTCSVEDRGIEHRIHKLAPSVHWTLVIDEGGVPPGRFGDAVPEQPPRFVGLLVPAEVALPPLPAGWHAAHTRDLAELDRVMQLVLDHPVGVFGLSLASLTPSAADVWMTGVLEVIHGALRQLPVAGPTRVDVHVEQRGEHAAGTNWQVLASEFMRHLAELDPDRHRHLEISVQVVAKDGSPYNGHVDAIAHAWSSPASHSRDRIRRSGLLGRCLLDLDASSLRLVWQALRTGARPDAAAWARLVERDHPPGSLVSDVLEDIRTLCREDAGTWQQLLTWVVNRLEGREVSLVTLGRAVAFLESCRPKGHDFPGSAVLAWHIATLEQQNHAGGVDETVARELVTLSERLFDEHPGLVCQADLVRAVLATNRFDFEGASTALERWMDREPAVAGLLRHGRVLSSIGQIHAFTGRPEAALRWFDRAIACFERLSDPARAALETEQTTVYRAFAALDLPGTELEPDAIRTAVHDLVNLMPARIDQMARDTSPRRMYLHHLMVRYLVERGDRFERQAYLAARDFWGDRPGHPWPLIQLYRGLLLFRTDPVDAREQFRRGITLATGPDQGPTVHYIALVMARLGRQMGMAGLADPVKVDELRAILPAATWGDLAAMERAPQDGFDPLVWLRRLLPFNFR